MLAIELPLLRDHLLRLDAESRHDRFNGSDAADAFRSTTVFRRCYHRLSSHQDLAQGHRRKHRTDLFAER
jgi:hypothetical protein